MNFSYDLFLNSNNRVSCKTKHKHFYNFVEDLNICFYFGARVHMTYVFEMGGGEVWMILNFIIPGD